MRCTDRRRIGISALLTCALLGAMVPVAQGDAAGDKARAQTLFKEGTKLLKEKSFIEACPKLEESAKLERAGGTVHNLGFCYEGLGRWATASAYFEESAALAKKAKNKEREDAANEHLTSLAPKISKLTISVPKAARVEGLSVKLDGGAVGESSWGVAFPIDPGTHSVEATATGRRSWKDSVVVGSTSESKQVDVPTLETAPVTTPVASAAPTASAGGGAVLPPPTTNPVKDDTHPPSHTAGWITLAAGGVFALGAVGTFFLAKGAQDDRRSYCASVADSTTCGDDDSKSRLHRWQTLSWVSAGLAVVGIGAGIVLLTSSGATSKPGSGGITLSVGAANLRIDGRF